jgi:hypothetical protein
MDSREYQQPSAPPPSYDSVVNANRQENRSDQYSNRNYPESRREVRIPDFDTFVRRYESKRFSQCTLIIGISIYLVNPTFAERLHGLKGYEIVFICDDSGSMSAPIGEFIITSYIFCLLPMYWLLILQEKLLIHMKNKLHAVRSNIVR